MIHVGNCCADIETAKQYTYMVPATACVYAVYKKHTVFFISAGAPPFESLHQPHTIVSEAPFKSL
jgi:hypothetical protein